MKYKIITFITLALPLPIYLFLQATVFNIIPDVVIYADREVLTIQPYEDMYFISNTLETQFNGYTIYYNNMIGVVVDDEDVIKTLNGYVSIKDNELVMVERTLFQKEQAYKIPVVVFISLFGIMIVAMLILKKMDMMKQYPRVSVLISLITGTTILYLLNTVIGGILGVFMVATVSWVIYCFEYMIHHGMVTREQTRKLESEMLKLLKEKIA